MGLDMYLYRKHYVKNWDHTGERWQVSVSHNGEPVPADQIDPAKVAYVTEQVAYWRKANQIHAWFVANVQDGVDECQASYVSEEKLAELLAAVRAVLADHSRAQELLPTQSGFFFGGTDVDDWYFKDLEETEQMLAPLVESETSGEYEYQSSW